MGLPESFNKSVHHVHDCILSQKWLKSQGVYWCLSSSPFDYSFFTFFILPVKFLSLEVFLNPCFLTAFFTLSPYLKHTFNSDNDRCLQKKKNGFEKLEKGNAKWLQYKKETKLSRIQNKAILVHFEALNSQVTSVFPSPSNFPERPIFPTIFLEKLRKWWVVTKV